MANERGGILRWLVILLLAGAAGWAFLRWSPLFNLKLYSANLDVAISHALAKAGVRDSDVQQTVHRERHRWALTWIASYRRIRVAPEALESVGKAIVEAAHSSHATVTRESSSDGVDLRVSLAGFLFQTIELVRAAAPVVSPGRLRPAPEVALVIDDTAYDTGTLDRYAALDVPLTFAILPRDKHSKAIADKAQSLHFPVILHLPMEPIDRVHNDPGPSALYLSMTEDQLHRQFERDLASVPHVVGINNHMGSAFTASEPQMDWVMQWVKQHGLFFLDSRTTGKSVVVRAARKAGVPCLINETFLDNSDDVLSIEHQLDQVMELALRQGRTIAIGHYRRKHLAEALAQKLPDFRARRIRLVTLPSLYNR